MVKRPRQSLSLDSRLRRIIISDAGLAVPGSSAEDVAHALRSRHREYCRYKLELFTSAVRRALSSLPPPPDAIDSDHDSLASHPSRCRRCRDDATSSSTTTHSPPLPAFEDVTKSLLRSSYSSQKSTKRAVDKQPEIELVTAEKVVTTPDTQGVGQRGGGKGSMFADLGGMEELIENLMMDLVVPLWHPELPSYLGVGCVRGILLHGPPGCGKTTLAHAIANETGVPFYMISGPEIVSGVSGSSEENIRALFNKAYRTAPSIVFIDEIDSIASKRDTMQREMERRIVTQLITCMDEFHQNISGGSDVTAGDTDDASQSSDQKRKPAGYVIVIGATNRPDAIDPALRRPGRFDREHYLGVPDEDSRRQILERLTRNLRLPPGDRFNLSKIAKATPGYVGADLKALEATKMLQPSLRREGFSSVPDVTWADVGGLDSLKKELHRCIVRCIKQSDYYKKFGVDMQDGFLLFGPPGCGKTLIAKAVAHDAGANFIHIKGPELLSKYVGESESEVRAIFTRARTNAPCILFFDEVDALTTTRGKEGGWIVERVLTQLLIELDGADKRPGVYVIGATNRIDMIDEAVLRPGRFGKRHFVPLPGANERASILKALALPPKKPVSNNVDLDALARREECNNLTGADLASLVNEAAMSALEESLELLVENNGMSSSMGCSIDPKIEISHFEQALSKVKPSVSDQQRKHYDALAEKYSAS